MSGIFHFVGCGKRKLMFKLDLNYVCLFHSLINKKSIYYIYVESSIGVTGFAQIKVSTMKD